MTAPNCPIDQTPLVRDEDGALVCRLGHEYEDYPAVAPTCETCKHHRYLEDYALGCPGVQVLCMGDSSEHGRAVSRDAVRACHSERPKDGGT